MPHVSTVGEVSVEKAILNIVNLGSANIESEVDGVLLGTGLSGVDIVTILGVEGDSADLSASEVLRVDVIVSIDDRILVDQIVLRSILVSDVVSVGRSAGITCILLAAPISSL